MLASEYGWTDEYILNKVYPDRLYFLSKSIHRRRSDDYIMQMHISAYPHMEEDAQKRFSSKLFEAQGQSYGVKSNKLDKAKLQALKRRLSGERRSSIRTK